MKEIMTEEEMEKALEELGIDIYDGNETVDSTIVIDEAINLGYMSKLDPETGVIRFVKL